MLRGAALACVRLRAQAALVVTNRSQRPRTSCSALPGHCMSDADLAAVRRERAAAYLHSARPPAQPAWRAAYVSRLGLQEGTRGFEAERLLELGWLPMPAIEKRPVTAHKAGSAKPWSRERALAALRPMQCGPGGPMAPTTFDAYPDLAVLCDRESRLMVLHFDSRAQVDIFRALALEAFDAAPCSTTNKGFHFFFCRTPLVESLGLYDGPIGGERGEDHERRCAVDLKTVCSNGTAGLCNVPPSVPFNRAWLRSPFLHPVPPFPDVLANHVMAMRLQFTKTKRKRAKGGAAGAAAAAATTGAAAEGACRGGGGGGGGEADEADIIVVDSD